MTEVVNTIERIRAFVEELKAEGVDALFIYAALHQVAADLQPEAEDVGRLMRDTPL